MCISEKDIFHLLFIDYHYITDSCEYFLLLDQRSYEKFYINKCLAKMESNEVLKDTDIKKDLQYVLLFQ